MEQARRTRGVRAPQSAEDRIRGTLQHAINNPLTKNPTRFVPDLPGFTALTKAEIKRDSWDIDHRSQLMDMNETDSEEEDFNQQSMGRSLEPRCAPESTIYKKKARLVSWVANPALAESDVKKSRESLAVVKEELERLIRQEEGWVYSLEMGRSFVSSSLLSCKNSVARLKADSKHLTALIMAECEATVAQHTTSNTSRKSSSAAKQATPTVTTLRGAMGELQSRFLVFQLRAKEYEDAAQEKSSLANGPITSIVVDELDYPEDAIVFAVKPQLPPPTVVVRGDNEAKTAEDDHLAQIEEAEARALKSSALKQEEEDDALFGKTGDMRELVRMIKSFDETALRTEASLGDLEVFFQDDETHSSKDAPPGAAGEVDAHLVEISNARKLIPSKEGERALSAGWEKTRSEAAWAKTLQDLVDSSKKRGRPRGPATVPASVCVFPRTPRDVPLIISPLSQFEDKYIGALMAGPNNAEVNKNYHPLRPRAGDLLPASIISAEEAVFERCRLQSAAAAAQNKIRRLNANAVEWKRQMQEGQGALQRSEKIYQQAVQDDYQESKRIRKELLDLGIASVGTNELPMSPIAETAGWKGMGNAGGGGGGGAATGQGGLRLGGRGATGVRGQRTKGVPKGFQARLDGLKAAAAEKAADKVEVPPVSTKSGKSVVGLAGSEPDEDSNTGVNGKPPAVGDPKKTSKRK